MKVRLFTVSILVVTITWLALLVPGGARPSAAQSHPAAPAPAPDRARVSAAFRSAPLMFIENVGQFDQRARFQVRGDHATLWLAEGGLWVTVGKGVNPSTPRPLDPSTGSGQGKFGTRQARDDAGSGHRLKLSFVGANPHPRLEAFNRLETHVSYFVGGDPARWRAGVPVWGGVRYVDLYPGLDLEVTGDGGRWAWQLLCRTDCQSALQHVRLGVDGADALSLDGDALHVTTALGEYTLPLLQVVGTADAKLPSPTITGSQVASPFAYAILNPQYAMANPQSGASDLLYSTFLGGSNRDRGHAIAADEAGSAYVTGWTYSSDFPTTTGAFDTSHDGGDAFVVKVNAEGTGLAYATFLGGNNGEGGHAIVVDGAGNAYVTGETSSPDFPTTAGAFDRSCGTDGDCNFDGRYPSSDAFVVKVNAEGTGLAYATFVGGSNHERSFEIAVDGAGSAYVTGDTGSSDFPTTEGAFDTICGTEANCNDDYRDAFVVKVNADGTGLAYATFLGGGNWDAGSAIAVDGADNAYVAGYTQSSEFPTTPGAFDTSLGGDQDAFVVKMNSGGTGLAYATLLGGSSREWGSAIALDGVGVVYVAGETWSSDFPTTAGAFDTSHNGTDDAFVVKLNAGGTGLVYATFLGGSGWDISSAIALDGAGNAYVTGLTRSSDFPTTAGAFDTYYHGGDDAFVVRVNAAGTGLAYATFLGGSLTDQSHAIAADGVGNTYVTGFTESPEFPTTAWAFDTSRNGRSDAFVAKVSTGEVPPTPTPSPPHALTNGGFEGGFYLLKGESIANGWSAYTLLGQPTFAGERFTVHSGQWAYKVAGYAPSTAGLVQTVSVQPGRTYRVTAYYQLYPPGDGQALLGVQDGTSATQWVGGGWPGLWLPLSQEITVTSDWLTITLQGRNGPDPNTNVYFDDVTVVAQ